MMSIKINENWDLDGRQAQRDKLINSVPTGRYLFVFDEILADGEPNFANKGAKAGTGNWILAKLIVKHSYDYVTSAVNQEFGFSIKDTEFLKDGTDDQFQINSGLRMLGSMFGKVGYESDNLTTFYNDLLKGKEAIGFLTWPHNKNTLKKYVHIKWDVKATKELSTTPPADDLRAYASESETY